MLNISGTCLILSYLIPGKRGSGSSSRFSPCELSPVDQSCITPPRLRQWSEPWLAIHNLAQLNKVYQEGRRERKRKREERKEEREKKVVFITTLRRKGGRRPSNRKRWEMTRRVNLSISTIRRSLPGPLVLSSSPQRSTFPRQPRADCPLRGG